MALLLIELDADGPDSVVLIERAAKELAKHTRETDTFSRIGESEFALLLENIEGSREASMIADKLLKILHFPLHTGSERAFVSGSIGISMFPFDDHEAEGLIRDARTAMEEARLQGHNTYSFFSSQMNADAGERLLLAGQLRQALERNELSLKYQPQFDAKTNELVGMEALLRWTNVALGMVGPDRFVPVAEDLGLMHPIGEWVLREACRQFADWKRQGCAPQTLSVNISAKQIAAADFIEMIESVLEDSGVDAECLELDLAESVLSSVPYVQQTIEGLLQMGVHIVIDDFGTGVTSLGHFTSLTFRKLKIDRKFIRGIGRDPAQEKVVRAIMGLAKTLRSEGHRRRCGNRRSGEVSAPGRLPRVSGSTSSDEPSARRTIARPSVLPELACDLHVRPSCEQHRRPESALLGAPGLQAFRILARPAMKQL